MAAQTKKKQTRPRTQTAKKQPKPAVPKRSMYHTVRARVAAFLHRRPHRSFRMTKRRDYTRALALPGYWALTFQVLGVLRANLKAVLVIIVLYGVLSIALLGLGSQEVFTQLRQTLNDSSEALFTGNWGELGKASLLAVSTLAGSIAPQLTEAQQVYAILMGLLVWLSVVWLLRQRMAGSAVTVRDALYNAGAPIVSTAVVFGIFMLQLIPVAVAAIGYTAAEATGLISGGVEAMLFWFAAGGLATLSIYWITSTVLALVVVTLPGMYPLRALSIAGDMVVGRRVRILLRLGWAVLLIVLTWIVVLTLVVLLDAGLKQLIPAVSWLPIVPSVSLMLSVSSLVMTTAYVYVLYRKVVDDDTKPA